MVDGETHYVWGHKYRLRILEGSPGKGVRTTPDGWLELGVRTGADRDSRERKLSRWYRQQLQDQLPGLIEEWVPVLGVEKPTWRLKRMKTKWGTCNPDKLIIWLNTELAKKPHECLEYIVVHEMIHLLERTHSDRFYELQNRFMPSWRGKRELLNELPLADEEWNQ
jgi:predicted metal-dependent hydrolase